MAGTIPISMTQQFTSQGVPLVGGKLYIFQTATTTPQSAYSDSGLTVALPNPITLDSSGRVPQFFLADGTIKVRLTDSSGTVQAEWDNLLVIGPTGGGGGGGATVDTTTIFQTGDVLWLDQAGVRSGWVRDNGRTIGSSTSGASERANSDCQNLFVFLYNTFSNSICPVSGGRGADAATDWSANKTIGLPDKRGYIVGGLDDMGNSAAGRYANVPVVSGSVTAAGSILGESATALTQAQLPSVNFTVSIPSGQGSHTHGRPSGQDGYLGTNGSGPLGIGTGSNAVVSSSTDSSTLPAMTGTAASGGSGSPLSRVQNTVIGTFYRKL